MYSFKTYPVFLILVSYVVAGQAANCPPDPPSPKAHTRLRERIFCDYDKLSRPVKNRNTTVSIMLNLMLNVVTMDEHSQIMTVEGRMAFAWYDEYLKWRPDDYDGIQHIKIQDYEIWVPDLTLNVFTLHKLNEIVPTGCIAVFTGRISCMPSVTMETPCIQNMRYWPYDVHNCTMTLSSFMHLESVLNISVVNMDTNLLQTNRIWEVISTKTERFTKNLTEFYEYPAVYPFASFNLIVRRHAASYVAASVYPAVCMLMLTLLTFWMGNMTTSRITINGFLVAGQVMFLDYSIWVIPPNGTDVPVIVTLYRDGLVLACLAIVVAVLVSNLLTSSTKPPLWLSGIINRIETSFIGQFLQLTEASTPAIEDEANIIEAAAKVRTSAWSPCAILLDRAAFAASLLVAVVLFLGYIP